MPSKWAGEWDVGQVDFVQFIESRQAYDVDVRKLKAIGGGLYTLPGGLSRPPAERVDVAKLGRIDAEFVSDRDAYLVWHALWHVVLPAGAVAGQLLLEP